MNFINQLDMLGVVMLWMLGVAIVINALLFWHLYATQKRKKTAHNP